MDHFYVIYFDTCITECCWRGMVNAKTKDNHDNNRGIHDPELFKISNIPVVIIVFLSFCILQVWVVTMEYGILCECFLCVRT
jgi:hypothetical protein